MARNLTTGTPWRVIGVFMVPLLIGNVVQQLYQVTDAMVVGRTLGVDALAAVGATGSLLFLLLGFAFGMTSGFAIPTAQAFGAGDLAAVRRSVAAGTLLTGAASIVVTVGGPLLAGTALRLLGTPEELVPQATTFAVVTFAGAATTMYFNFLAAIIRAIGDSRTPLLFLVVSCLLNIGLVLAIVRGAGYGVGGAALATVIAQLVSVVLCLLYVRSRVPVLHVHRADWRVPRADLREHLRIGLPMGFQMSIIAIGAVAVQVRLNTLGADAVAAYTTALRVDGISMAVMSSLGIAASTYTAQNYGAGRYDRIRSGIRQAIVMAVVAALTIGAALALWGAQFVRLFVGGGEEQVVDMAALFLLVNGSLYWVLAVLFVVRGALQALGRTFTPTASGVVELGMRIGAAMILGATFGFPGVVWANPLAWAGAVAVLLPGYVRARRALQPGSPGRPVTTPELVAAMPAPIGAAAPEASTPDARPASVPPAQ